MLSGLLSQAWATRIANFGKRVEFTYPTLTKSVSLTDDSCGLACAHCGGHYLQGMIGLDEAQTLGTDRAKSLLISGGCSPAGKVPFMHRLKELEALAQEHRLNFHVGLVNEEEAAVVGRLATAVSFDVVGDDETIREVYGLDATVADYMASYEALRRHCHVVPHICLGLRAGKISGEYRALDMLQSLGAEALVFIVLIPTPGTLYADVSPPAPAEAALVLANARLRFPDTPILLGCMRPGGRHRRALDLLSIRASVNKIVNPTPAAVKLAAILGLEATKGRECCVL